MTAKQPTDEEWPRRATKMAEFGRRIAARKAELGLPTDPYGPESCRRLRNSGADRTPSKRALLAEIEKLGAEW